MKINKFQLYATSKDDERSFKTHEIAISADPATLRKIGLFFINSAHEMDFNETDHIHLQDRLTEFSHKKHCEIVLINSKKIKRQ
ncbi:Imm32 family immunity protein [Paracidovorax avenae]|uniref:Imm32 family immunity protein n=1 Tax=Paracidovorax avenae TaxID=80867 RepID=UPI0012FD4368|nr:hypothetical protein [Paracidovorax avenae]